VSGLIGETENLIFLKIENRFSKAGYQSKLIINKDDIDSFI